MHYMSLAKKILLALLIVFIAIQFVQPAHNKSERALPADITKTYNLPENVQTVFKNACYDCHSNNTHYPWYSNIQPIGWLLANDVRKGKGKLNFSEFGSYSPRKQRSKLREIQMAMHDGTMPLSTYKLMHRPARLTKDDKAIITDWTKKTKDSITTKIKQ